MDTDCHGIAHEYEDAFGILRVTSRATRDAIRRAMHADEAPAAEPAVRVIDRRKKSSLEVGPGDLRLEDGTQLQIVDRLPADVPYGYHDFLPRGRTGPLRLIISPGRCHAPPKQPVWGWAVQLYAARSMASWGLGDLADLRTIGERSKSLGASFLLVNPLPAVDPVLPQATSPYYPTSRRFRNPIYLRVEDVPGAAAVLGTDLEALARAGRQLNSEALLNRDEAFRLKQQALEKIWEHFSADAEFDRYRQEIGPPLRQFATYCVLVEHHGPDWTKWDAAYRNPEAPGIARFEAANLRRIEYHEWLQWQVDRQLVAAGVLPIVQDMPIGISPHGADAWAWQDVLGNGMSIGAPPDLYNTQGQDWGMPPWAPRRLQAAKYEPFAQTIRALLRHAGGLRIDHILGLFRLFWIPHGSSAVEGTYVEYPADDLLNIVALESYRARAFIVGEDLGTVGKNVRRMLAAARILSCRLLWFERQPPPDYPQLALAAVTTHDLPTVAGLWTGSDLAAQQAIGLKPDAKATQAIRDRLETLIDLDEHAATTDVIRATHEVLAQSPSALVTATLEDAAATERRPNMPATVNEWPNWRIPLPAPLEELFESPLVHSIAGALSKRASAKSPSKSASNGKPAKPGAKSPAAGRRTGRRGS